MLTAITRYGVRVPPHTDEIIERCASRGEILFARVGSLRSGLVIHAARTRRSSYSIRIVLHTSCMAFYSSG